MGGADASAYAGEAARTSPPRASNNSACFVFFDPSFIPAPLKAGAREGAELGEGELYLLVGDETSGASNRETGAYPVIPPPR